jgi:seryl-tRNA synthetase
MHDIRLIRENPEAFDAALARRGVEPSSAALAGLDARRRAVATKMQEAQNRRNEVSKAIGAAKAQKREDEAAALMAEVAELKQVLPMLDQEDRDLSAQLQDALARLPNLPGSDVPDGEDETANVEIARWGNPRTFGFEPKEHADLGPALGLDFETGADIAGARFTFLRGQMARLQRAIGQYMLDIQTGSHGYTECAPPLLVRDEAVFGTGQLPKFADDLFRTTDGRWLIPTAEVSLTNAVRDRIMTEAQLPIRMTALTPCFRSEAGAAGKDTRGYIRQHQFDKVELVSICRPEDSATEHERMTGAAAAVPRVQPSRKCLAVHPRQLALKPYLQVLQ